MSNDFGQALRIAGGGLLAAGLLAAGAAVGSVVERAVLNNSARKDDGAGDLGSLRGTVVPVTTDDGIVLHAEIDEASNPGDGAITIVFAHGYALSLDSWHYQRAALRGKARLVFFDQRSHGRSQRADFDTHHIDQLGRDLYAVITALAPAGPLILVGHSMGGMTVMSLAAQYPDLIRERVFGAAFIATTASSMQAGSLGLPVVGPLMFKAAPHVTALLARRKSLVERTRRSGSDLALLLTRMYSFGSVASDAAGKFVARMIAGTPIDVIAEFLPALQDHDKVDALPVFGRAEVLVIAGASDRLVPVSAAEQIVAAIPGAEYALIGNAGHMVTVEYPDLVNDLLLDLLARVRRDVHADAASVAR